MATKTKAAKKEVQYDKVEVEVFRGEDALTIENLKELIGWEEVEAKTPDCIPEIFTICEKNVRLTKNSNNRYLTKTWLLTLRQEHLNNRWRFNGEALVIGEYGNIQSGQHRILSAILAEIERTESKNKDRWIEVHPDPVTLETVVVYGVSEDDDTFRSLNQGKPGTGAEVLYRSEYFKDFSALNRKVLAKMTDAAVGVLWDRTKVSNNPFAKHQTHAEIMDFIERHKRIIRAVKHVHTENKDGGITNLKVSPGACAALLYLFGCCNSDGDGYSLAQREGNASERKLTWDNWDKATEFFTGLAKEAPELSDVKDVIAKLVGRPISGLPNAKLSVIVKAWNAFVEGRRITAKTLSIENDLTTLDDGVEKLEKVTSCGGIDFADKVEEKDPDLEEVDENDTGDDDPDEIERRKDQVREESLAKKRKGKGKSKVEANGEDTDASHESEDDDFVMADDNPEGEGEDEDKEDVEEEEEAPVKRGRGRPAKAK